MYYVLIRRGGGCADTQAKLMYKEASVVIIYIGAKPTAYLQLNTSMDNYSTWKIIWY